jgi:hypothetical protein
MADIDWPPLKMSLQSEHNRDLLAARFGLLQSIDPGFIDPIGPMRVYRYGPRQRGDRPANSKRRSKVVADTLV